MSAKNVSIAGRAGKLDQANKGESLPGLAQAMAPGIQYQPDKPSAVGALGSASFSMPSFGRLQPFSQTMANSSTSASKNFMIGDPDGLVAELKGGTIAAADSGTVTPANTNEFFRSQPVAIGAIQYDITTGGAAQFTETFQFLAAAIDGNLITVNLAAQVNAARRNTAQTATLQTIEFPTPVVLRQNTGIYLVVAASTTVVLTLVPVAVDGLL